MVTLKCEQIDEFKQSVQLASLELFSLKLLFHICGLLLVGNFLKWSSTIFHP